MNTGYLTYQAVERVVGAHGTGTIEESESDDLGEWVIVVFGNGCLHFMEAAKTRPVLTCEVKL
jgi:hypothetical protein